jgi:hypothetical protein
MEQTIKREPVSVRGRIDILDLNEVLKLPKYEYKLSSVRATAGAITGDTGKTFSVTTFENTIIVKRNT